MVPRIGQTAAHREMSRKVRDLMKEDAKVKNADERKSDFADKVEERKRRET